MGTRTATAIRFDPDVHSRLVEYSDALGMPINWLVNRAVAVYLAGLPPADEVEVELVRKPGDS